MQPVWQIARQLLIQGTICSLGLVCDFLHPATATVMEFDQNGKATIAETKPEQATPSMRPSNSKYAAYKKMARDIAVKYSGALGVRKVQLDALTFVNIFQALIERESNFDPLVVSPKGAVGLGQLMPETAKDMYVDDPLDPEANLLGSAKYFTLLLDQFENLEFALAAYNAGPERVKQYGGVPPFKETKAYISWILAKAGVSPSKLFSKETNLPKNRFINVDPPLKGAISVWEF